MDTDGYEDIEHRILTFHLARVSAKRGKLNSAMNAPALHFAESNWRFENLVLVQERGEEPVKRLMYANLLEYVRQFGPVGLEGTPSPVQKKAGRMLAMDQFDRKLLWLERNSSRFRGREERAELRKLRNG